MATSFFSSLSFAPSTARFPLASSLSPQLPPSFPAPNSISLGDGRGSASLPILGAGSLSLSSSDPLSSSSSVCRLGYNVQMIVEEDEPEESLVRRFRGEVLRAGVIQECRRRRFFENKQEKRKRKSRESARRNRQRNFNSRRMISEEEEFDGNEGDDFDESEDNWEMID